MQLDLENRCLRLSVGEFADFSLGPRSSEGGASGLWRAQLGTRWHQQLRERAAAERPDARFEVGIEGELVHRGWRIQLQGRIDQWWPESSPRLREIKTITAPLPLADDELRQLYPSYFLQLAVYLRLVEQNLASSLTEGTLTRGRGELVFLEIGSGLLQSVFLHDADTHALEVQLERVAEFLDLRWRSRERLRQLSVQAPFTAWRPAQEQGALDLAAAWQTRPIVCFEAPTGYGKTGVLLQAALRRLQNGDAERLIYLSAKGTGQWQVMATLQTMTSGGGHEALSAWQVRPKSEHCIHTEMRCHPDLCPHLRDIEARWPRSGLSRFYTLPGHPRDLPNLRAAGREASLCPYEITRAGLPFAEVWVGDMNYVFAPSIRGLFFEQPGFAAERTLLIVDEAHHLPSRAADALTHSLRHEEAATVLGHLHRVRAPAVLVRAWDHWAHLLRGLEPCDAVSLALEDDLREVLGQLARQMQESPLDSTQLDAEVTEALWQPVRLQQDLQAHADLPRLWTCGQPRTLQVVCLDAKAVIGPLLRSFAGVALTSATFGPTDEFERACGLDLDLKVEVEKTAAPESRFGKLTLRETRKLFKGLQSGGDLLRVVEAENVQRAAWVQGEAPWRLTAYDVACDLRVDTRYQHREAHLEDTATTLLEMIAQAPADQPCVGVFFPSFSYAEQVRSVLARKAPDRLVALQPRAHEKVDTASWIERSLGQSHALFLVLGSSLAESIDQLGGRLALAVVVGPALPEVNAVQRAKLALHETAGRDAAFRSVYQIPGMQRVNQALGRLVRAPGQKTRVLLHCQRFGDARYQALLNTEYRQSATFIRTAAEWQEWLGRGD